MKRICLLLTGTALALAMSSGAAAAQMESGSTYCFGQQEFGPEGLEGICITSLPSGSTGTLMLGSRILQPGDILPVIRQGRSWSGCAGLASPDSICCFRETAVVLRSWLRFWLCWSSARPGVCGWWVRRVIVLSAVWGTWEEQGTASLIQRSDRGDHMELKEVEAAIEAILFAAGDPVGVERLCLALNIDRFTADAVCQRLADRYSYERRGIRIVKLESSYQLCSAPEYASYIRKAFESRKPARLSQPALEVLAIIAYYQPATKAYVDQLRGVDSTYTVSLLAERELIEECGRLAVPGRPILYRTTQNFLRSFGLASLEELPDLPGASTEEEQLTMNMQMAVDKLRAEAEAANVSDEEMNAAAQELANEENTSDHLTEGRAL